MSENYNLTGQPIAEVVETNEIYYNLIPRMKSGANWFYWIAGLSLINSLIVLFNGDLAFTIGLGITQLIDGIVIGISGEGAGITAIRIFGFVIDSVIAAIFAGFGYFAARMQMWAFITGMLLYLLDTAIFIFSDSFLGVAFHIFALICIFRGFQAARTLKGKDLSQFPI
jgi:hypothetical protein